MTFNREKYLERIAYSGPLNPSIETLKNLQKCHLLNVPFENLDIYEQRKIHLSIDKIYTKVVIQKRGGFCFELNGLFYELLTDLGYNVKRISAKVYDPKKGFGKEFDHLSLVVKIDGKDYLTDVGFGEFSFAPLEIVIGSNQIDDRGVFSIEHHDNRYLVVNHHDQKNTTPKFIFTTTARQLEEFDEMCEDHQINPESKFTGRRLISLPTENGRVTIAGNRLNIKELNTSKTIRLQNDLEFKSQLWKHFKVAI